MKKNLITILVIIVISLITALLVSIKNQGLFVFAILPIILFTLNAILIFSIKKYKLLIPNLIYFLLYDVLVSFSLNFVPNSLDRAERYFDYSYSDNVILNFIEILPNVILFYFFIILIKKYFVKI